MLDSLELHQKEIFELKQEIARLKKQPKAPQFTSSKKSSATATNLLKEKNNRWHKASRKPVEIDQRVELSEVDMCVCGSTKFETINTKTKVVQGLVIQRNNTAFHIRKKKCVACGKIFTPQIPAGVKGLSFDSNL